MLGMGVAPDSGWISGVQMFHWHVIPRIVFQCTGPDRALHWSNSRRNIMVSYVDQEEQNHGTELLLQFLPPDLVPAGEAVDRPTWE